MNRRSFITKVAMATALTPVAGSVFAADTPATSTDAVTKDWVTHWEKHILAQMHDRYCDREMGEELGWLMSPFLNAFYFGYEATHDAQWVERLADWTDSWLKRSIKEPDGYVGWPKKGTGGVLAENLYSDSLLGEAMAFYPVVRMVGVIKETPALKERFGTQAESWLKLASQTFEKWVARGCWRESKSGGVWVVPAFGLDSGGNKWTDGYAERNTRGFSNPANKQNHIARWLIAMYDVTNKPEYKDHAERWWHVMKLRMRPRDNGKYFVWNYWDPAGPWDYKPDGTTQHWVGVHPNGGYYAIDLEGIVTAFEHGLVFTREDINRLIATNRDFMWNQQLVGAKFQRIDGGEPDRRWKNSPGSLWSALVPYDETLNKIFVANNNPESWGGLTSTPWYLALKR